MATKKNTDIVIDEEKNIGGQHIIDLKTSKRMVTSSMSDILALSLENHSQLIGYIEEMGYESCITILPNECEDISIGQCVLTLENEVKYNFDDLYLNCQLCLTDYYENSSMFVFEECMNAFFTVYSSNSVKKNKSHCIYIDAYEWELGSSLNTSDVVGILSKIISMTWNKEELGSMDIIVGYKESVFKELYMDEDDEDLDIMCDENDLEEKKKRKDKKKDKKKKKKKK